RLNPKDRFYYGAYARLLATCTDGRIRDGERAILMATKACELTDWMRGRELDTLAAAYAEAGQFEEAERYQRMALDHPEYVSPDGAVAGFEVAGYRQRLELYKQKKPYRQNR